MKFIFLFITLTFLPYQNVTLSQHIWDGRIIIYSKDDPHRISIYYEYETGRLLKIIVYRKMVPGIKYTGKEKFYKLPDSLTDLDRSLILDQVIEFLPDYKERYIKKFGRSPLLVPNRKE